MNRGIPPPVPDPDAATDGREVRDGVGLFIAGGAFWSGARAKLLASVATLETDMLRAGDSGRAAGVKGEGEGFVGSVLLEMDCCRGTGGPAGGGAFAEVDGAVGVA